MQPKIVVNKEEVKPTDLTLGGKLSWSFLKMFGWKIFTFIPEETNYVVIQAPHTSNWDFFWGKLFNFVVKMTPVVLIKKELFFWPLGPILRALGGIPVDRHNRKVRKADLLVDEFAKQKNFVLAITPEGTRSRNPNWKTGFYHIAVKAGVPILIGVIDYKKKEIGTFALFYPTGEFQSDFKTIRKMYQGVGAKHPEKFSIGNDLEQTE